jgi:molybdopterin-containing oxidoreductase family iron-sulfur binding subunit
VEKTVLDLTEQQRTDEARQRRQAMYNDLQTACQQACPTGAIVFGDITDRQSTVATLKAQPHDYTLLDELTTRPRTSYLARVTNPNPALGEGGVA